MTLMRSIFIGEKGLDFWEDTPYIILSAYRTYLMGHVLYYIPVIDDILMTFSLSLLVPLGMNVAILRVAFKYY